jgi:hypothetical protein
LLSFSMVSWVSCFVGACIPSLRRYCTNCYRVTANWHYMHAVYQMPQ